MRLNPTRMDWMPNLHRSLITKPVRRALSDGLRKFGNDCLQLMQTISCFSIKGNSSQVLELVNK